MVLTADYAVDATRKLGMATILDAWGPIFIQNAFAVDLVVIPSLNMR